MRPSHFLSKNAKSEQPSHFIFVDVETESIEIESDKYEAKLTQGIACYYRRTKTRSKTYEIEEWFEFTTTGEFNNWLLSKLYSKTKLWVFAHNMKFDFQVLGIAKFMLENQFTPEIVVIDSPPFFIQYRKDSKRILFICSMNYFTTSLKKLGESIGKYKLQMPDKNASKDLWREYNKQDVVILKEAILLFMQFVKQNDLGNFQKTLASQTFAAYRHRFMQKSIFIHSDEEILKLERAAYHGGRNECFRIGEYVGNYYLLDVNSMYPAVMLDNEYPYEMIGYADNPSINQLISALKVYCVIAEVIVETDTPVYPVIKDNKLIFPVGKFCSTLSTPELNFALQNNHIIKINKLVAYKKYPIFHNYVSELYALRMKYREHKNYAFDYMVKIMMNSLYGKFGQSGKHWETIDSINNLEFEEWIEKDLDTGEIKKYRKILGSIQTMSVETESFNSFPAIAAHVTAYARMLLWNYIQIAGKENVLYVDTDSLLVNQKGLDNLNHYLNADKLGYLKLEHAFNYIKINSPKDYIFDNIVKIKGVRPNAIKINDNEFKQEQFWGVSHAWSQKVYDKQIIEVITKKLSRIYTKGEIKENGEISPFCMQLEE